MCAVSKVVRSATIYIAVRMRDIHSFLATRAGVQHQGLSKKSLLVATTKFIVWFALTIELLPW